MADTYNVFISWSGERSKRVAAALYDWLPIVVQSARPWMSEEDIEKGSRGLEEIGKALESMSVGIICLTPENLEKPWILFETGALSKALGDKTRVCPYLFGDLRAENVKPPLGMFQATRAVKEDTRKLVRTVNRVLGGPLVEEKLDTLFDGMWGILEGKLNGIGPGGGVVAPQRAERDMLAEVLELSRGGDTWNAQVMDTLRTILHVVHEISVFTRAQAVSPTAESENAYSYFARILKAVPAAPEGESAEERAERAGLIREAWERMGKEVFGVPYPNRTRRRDASDKQPARPRGKKP